MKIAILIAMAIFMAWRSTAMMDKAKKQGSKEGMMTGVIASHVWLVGAYIVSAVAISQSGEW